MTSNLNVRVLDMVYVPSRSSKIEAVLIRSPVTRDASVATNPPLTCAGFQSAHTESALLRSRAGLQPILQSPYYHQHGVKQIRHFHV
jgi:hypothetical protein